ncbi:Membrane protein involved in the export of O-antigen and teichoic acid [Myroides sp. A21]|uniref:oligosaccharide flippase family protein n=1 Tax=Myroides sp. A21 TaxID=1583100 RepID=UPI00057DEF3F|nr:oligosaccharide flippase family protein [Myroides sp. A21]AJA70396.1 Membrane protein involved in the export of O-antigen and teichoic acid [Myroides sp. A21]
MTRIASKGLAFNAYIIYSRLILSILISIFTSRVLLKGLGIENFGLYSVVTGIVAAIGIINTIMLTASNRFIAIAIGKGEDYTDEAQEVFSISLTLHLCIIAIVLVIGKVIGYFWIENYLNNTTSLSNNQIHIIFNTSLVILMFNILSVPFLALMTAKEDFKYQSNITLLQGVLLLLIAFLIEYLKLSVVMYSLMVMFIYCMTYTLNMRNTFKKYKEVRLKINFNQKKIKEMFSYSGWMSIGAFSYMFKNQGNAVIINYFFGPAYNSSFALAYQVYNQVNNLVLSLNKVFLPKIFKSFGRSNAKGEQVELGLMSSRYLFLIAVFLGFPFIVFGDEILNLWLKEVPPYTNILLILMVIDLILSMTNNGISNMIFARGNVRNYQIQTNVLGLFSIPLTILFFYLDFPMYYAIVTTVIMTLFVNYSKIRFANKYFNLTFKTLFERNYKYQLMVLTGIILIVFFRFCFLREHLILVFQIIICLVLFLIMLLLFGISKEERIVIFNYIKTRI